MHDLVSTFKSGHKLFAIKLTYLQGLPKGHFPSVKSRLKTRVYICKRIYRISLNKVRGH